MKIIRVGLAAALMSVAIVTPAQAESCTVSLGSICVPGLPTILPAPVPAPTSPPTSPPAAPSSRAQAAPTTPSQPVQQQPEVTPKTSIPEKTNPVYANPATKAPTTTPGGTENQVTTAPAPVASKPMVKTRYISVPKAMTMSFIALFAGAALLLVVMYVMYWLGRRDGENSMNDFMLELRSLVRKKKTP